MVRPMALYCRCRGCPGLSQMTASPLYLGFLRSSFSVWTARRAKTLEELQEENIRADTDPSEKRRVNDYYPEELRQVCDISRLPLQLQAKMRIRERLVPPENAYGATIEKQRMIYARLGKKSGLPPGIMWPTKSQVRAAKEDENVYFATLQEMIQAVKDTEAQEKNKHQQRQEQITEAMKEMPSLIAEFEERMKVKADEEREMMRKKAELLEEAREYFGYAISEGDDRIVKFLEQKEQAEEERKKVEKKARKAAEAKAALEELARKAAAEALKAAEIIEEAERSKQSADVHSST